MPLDKLEKNISLKLRTKKKVSTKLLVVVGITSLVGFVVVIIFAMSVFRDFAGQTTESESNFSFVKRGVVVENEFILINCLGALFVMSALPCVSCMKG